MVKLRTLTPSFLVRVQVPDPTIGKTMNKNIDAYVKVYENWLDHEICDKTIEDLQSQIWFSHTFTSYVTHEDISLSGDKELDVTAINCLVSENKYLMGKIWLAYRKYIDDLNFGWYGSWTTYSPLRFNKYTESKQMALHCDHIHSIFDGTLKGVPVLTALGVLNDDYEGGEFVMFEDTVIELKKGSVMVFPSNFLFPHRVDPVSKGVRYTFVTWCW